MKVAVFGDPDLQIQRLEDYLPQGVTELVSGRSGKVDDCTRAYAKAHGLPLRSFPVECQKYWQSAFIRRIVDIVDYVDEVVFLSSEDSDGVPHVLEACWALDKEVSVYLIPNTDPLDWMEPNPW